MVWTVGLIALASASAAASAAPKPIGDVTRWISAEDYPRQALQAAVGGDVRYTLQVDADGKVANCIITQSSGNQALDEATCTIITARARFVPARDENGQAIAGLFLSGIDWKIPDSGPIPLPSAQSIEQHVTFNVDPRGRANSCLVDGEVPSWIGLIENICDRLPSMKILFTPEQSDHTRHVAITVHFDVSEAKP